MSLQVRILTPESIFLNASADEIILPTNTGQMGVLSNHTPLITAIDIGPMLLRSDSNWQSIALLGGFALVKDNQIIILVNEAELGSEINSEEAEANFLTAKEALANSQTRKAQIENNLAFKRARVRYQVASQSK
jgi:F-type H+-transporting ATPase subunit epsilon